jgi:cullin-associated NEDD8-dissociated protein 1
VLSLFFPFFTLPVLSSLPFFLLSGIMCLLESCRPVPGYVSQTIFSDSIQPGWTWLPYNAKNTVLLAKGEGVDGSVATCATLSQGGAVKFNCRQCSRPGYQPFAKATSLQFDIRSNTKSDDEFASSTPRGKLPGIKLYLMNVIASVLWFF